jgi:AcrR family transcriptional regulator
MLFSVIKRREQIVSAAITLIDECGMQAVSTKEIARRLGISEGTIFNYFAKKDDLLEAALDQFSQYDDDLFLTAKMKNSSSIDAICYYINSYSVFYENYPAIVALYQAYDVLNFGDVLNQKIKNIYLRRKQFIKDMIQDGQSKSEIKNDINGDILACIITSSVIGVYLEWRIENHKFILHERVIETLNILINSIRQ